MENLIISEDRRLTIQIARAIQENLMRNIPVTLSLTVSRALG